MRDETTAYGLNTRKRGVLAPEGATRHSADARGYVRVAQLCFFSRFTQSHANILLPGRGCLAESCVCVLGPPRLRGYILYACCAPPRVGLLGSTHAEKKAVSGPCGACGDTWTWIWTRRDRRQRQETETQRPRVQRPCVVCVWSVSVGCGVCRMLLKLLPVACGSVCFV